MTTANDRTLGDVMPLARRCLEATVEHFTEHYGYPLTVDDLRGPKRNRALMAARRHAAWMMAGTEILSQEDMGTALNRDRSSISYILHGKPGQNGRPL